MKRPIHFAVTALLVAGGLALARDARVFPLTPVGSGGAGGSLPQDCAANGDGGIICRMFAATATSLSGVTVDAGIQTDDGGGLGMTRVPAYNCSGVVNGVPCVANTTGIIELYGSLPVGTSSDSICAVEVYDFNTAGAGATTCVFGVGIGASSAKIMRVMGDSSLEVEGDIRFSAAGANQIKQDTADNYIEFAGQAATGGVALYLSNVGAGLASSGTMLALYNPGFSGSNIAQIEYDGALVTASARTKGTLTLSGGSATRTVISGSICVCSNTSALNAVQCNVAATTLTATGTGTDVIAYICL